jgi:hypothetical protein
MLTTVIPLVIVACVTVWIVALVDLIRATDMDPVARLILALLLILAAPVGVVVWIVVRAGRPGTLAPRRG